MKNTFKVLTILLSLFISLPLAAATCVASDQFGHTWTVANPDITAARSLVWSTCRAVTSPCFVQCGPTLPGPAPAPAAYYPAPAPAPAYATGGGFSATCIARGQAGIVVTPGQGFGPTRPIARANAINQALYNCQMSRGVNCFFIPGSCRFSFSG